MDRIGRDRRRDGGGGRSVGDDMVAGWEVEMEMEKRCFRTETSARDEDYNAATAVLKSDRLLGTTVCRVLS